MRMNVDTSARTRAKTIRLTGRMAVHLMAEAEIPDAANIVRYLGSKGAFDITDPDLRLCCTLVVEAKYRTMCRLIKKTCHRTVVDLPCGYTPKALHLTERGMRYIGLDQPVVSREAGNILAFLAEHPQRMEFHGTDATDRDSLAAALAHVNGTVCVSTDGLTTAFSEREACAVVDNIRDLLADHGGCWITADPESMLQFFLTARAVLGDGAIERLAALSNGAANLWEVDRPANPFIVDPEDVETSLGTAMECLRQHGLKARSVKLADHMPELIAYRRMTRAQVIAFKTAMRYCHFWVITPDEDAKPRRRRRYPVSPR